MIGGYFPGPHGLDSIILGYYLRRGLLQDGVRLTLTVKRAENFSCRFQDGGTGRSWHSEDVVADAEVCGYVLNRGVQPTGPRQAEV